MTSQKAFSMPSHVVLKTNPGPEKVILNQFSVCVGMSNVHMCFQTISRPVGIAAVLATERKSINMSFNVIG